MYHILLKMEEFKKLTMLVTENIYITNSDKRCYSLGNDLTNDPQYDESNQLKDELVLEGCLSTARLSNFYSFEK